MGVKVEIPTPTEPPVVGLGIGYAVAFQEAEHRFEVRRLRVDQDAVHVENEGSDVGQGSSPAHESTTSAARLAVLVGVELDCVTGRASDVACLPAPPPA